MSPDVLDFSVDCRSRRMLSSRTWTGGARQLHECVDERIARGHHLRKGDCFVLAGGNGYAFASTPGAQVGARPSDA